MRQLKTEWVIGFFDPRQNAPLRVLCFDCIDEAMRDSGGQRHPVKIYRENIGSYYQTCHSCDKVLVEPHMGQRPSGWPELFTKPPMLTEELAARYREAPEQQMRIQVLVRKAQAFLAFPASTKTLTIREEISAQWMALFGLQLIDAVRGKKDPIIRDLLDLIEDFDKGRNLRPDASDVIARANQTLGGSE